MYCTKVLYSYLFSGKGPIAFCDIVGTEKEDTDESLKGSKMNLDEARKAVSSRPSLHCVVHHLLCQLNPTYVPKNSFPGGAG